MSVKAYPRYKRVCTSFQQHQVLNVFLGPHWHSTEPTPHYLHELTNWLGWLIGLHVPGIETRYLIFSCAAIFCLFPLKYHRTTGGDKRERAVSG